MNESAELGRDRGAVLVEFALVLPLLLAVLFGIVQFGLVLNVQIGLQGAAREGARAVAVGETPKTYPIPGGQATITVDKACKPGVSGDAIVTASTVFTLNLPFVPSIDSNRTAKATMRCET